MDMSSLEPMRAFVQYTCSNLVRFWWKCYKRRKDKKLAALKAAEEEKARLAALKAAKAKKGKKGKKGKKKGKKKKKAANSDLNSVDVGGEADKEEGDGDGEKD